MAATIRLTVLTGPHKGTRYCTRGLDACMIGRSEGCDVRFCGQPRDQSISRFHCQMILDPPLVRLQDMHSSNGTFVNGHPVQNAGAAEDGDVLTIGGTSMLMNIVECPLDFEKVKQGCPEHC